jgi:hypothetical protein
MELSPRRRQSEVRHRSRLVGSQKSKSPDALLRPEPGALARLLWRPSRTRQRKSCTGRDNGTPIYISGGVTSPPTRLPATYCPRKTPFPKG